MKIIFVTGGVLSGIGKGITASSIGAVLRGGGYEIAMQKLDGYLNVDPGTMSPFQHGEVFVTEDGAETDLDLGHYERFIDKDLNSFASFTSGKFFEEILKREREGYYLGKTVQIIPHLTNLVKETVKKAFTSNNSEILIVEIGGTVGDLENGYLLESARELRNELGKENVLFVHVTLLPYLESSKDLKTKPTQHSIRELMAFGIIPDFLVLRADKHINEELIEKVSYMCSIDKSKVIPSPTLKSIYEVPLKYQERNIGDLILKDLSLENRGFNLEKWEKLNQNIKSSKKEIIIGMIGKYNGLEDSYYSLNEGLKIAGFENNYKVKLEFIDAEEIEKNGVDILKNLDGICLPGGFGNRGIEGMIKTCEFARINKIPYLGVCLGSQIMAIEFARNILKFSDANSEEFDASSKNKVVHLMESQKGIYKKGGTMRLGSYTCMIKLGTLAYEVYKKEQITERHRHRFEFNNAYRKDMESNGFLISGKSPDGELVEIVEIKNHPFMIGSQFHPEFKSRPTNSHPLFLAFIKAIIECKV
ncbi:MAG: CTP synthase [Candidatus Gracilibacteria bacterium]|nr:CTP synthase [Candidatus Gracilibacteria bacterium]